MKPTTVVDLLNAMGSGTTEIHLSAGSWVEGGMKYRKDGMGMGIGGTNDWQLWQVSSDVVTRVKTLANATLGGLESK